VTGKGWRFTLQLPLNWSITSNMGAARAVAEITDSSASSSRGSRVSATLICPSIVMNNRARHHPSGKLDSWPDSVQKEETY